jgi:hypothetical protein
MEQISQDRQKAYLGTGWASPLRVNLQGSIQLSSAERNIEESISTHGFGRTSVSTGLRVASIGVDLCADEYSDFTINPSVRAGSAGNVGTPHRH